MNRSAYVAPLSAEEAEALKKLSTAEVKYLRQVFSNATFIKALRRANLAKPLKSLAEIKGWEKYEKALLVSGTPEEITELAEVQDDYDPNNNLDEDDNPDD